MFFSSPEIIAAIGLAFYGYRTVLIEGHLYPVLLWGFASTGLGVLLCQMASILRAMGPLRSWGRGRCCMAPPPGRRYKQDPEFLALEARGYRKQLVVRDIGGVTSCCASQWSNDCSSSTARSYFSAGAGGGSSDSKHYCHYEELSFPDLSDMPPPPPELLDQPTPQHPPLLFHMQPVVPYPDEDNILHRSQPLLHAISRDGATGACIATATVCCHQPLLAGSSSTWHPQQNQSLQQHPSQHRQTLQQQPQHSTPPRHQPSPLFSGPNEQQSALPKARPRGVRNQAAPSRNVPAHTSRRASGQSSRRPSGESSRRPSGQSNSRRYHQPSGSASSVKSYSGEPPQVHRYQTMPQRL